MIIRVHKGCILYIFYKITNISIYIAIFSTNILIPQMTINDSSSFNKFYSLIIVGVSANRQVDLRSAVVQW